MQLAQLLILFYIFHLKGKYTDHRQPKIKKIEKHSWKSYMIQYFQRKIGIYIQQYNRIYVSHAR